MTHVQNEVRRPAQNGTSNANLEATVTAPNSPELHDDEEEKEGRVKVIHMIGAPIEVIETENELLKSLGMESKTAVDAGIVVVLESRDEIHKIGVESFAPIDGETDEDAAARRQAKKAELTKYVETIIRTKVMKAFGGREYKGLPIPNMKVSHFGWVEETRVPRPAPGMTAKDYMTTHGAMLSQKIQRIVTALMQDRNVGDDLAGMKFPNL